MKKSLLIVLFSLLIFYTNGVKGYVPEGVRAYANTSSIKSIIISKNTSGIGSAPVAENQTVSLKKGTSKAINLIATDADGDVLTYSIKTLPSHGTLSCTNCANPTYIPSSNYHGSDSFTFRVNDGKVNSNVATVSIHVTSVMAPPVAQNKSVTTPEDTSVAIKLSVSSTNCDAGMLTYTIVNQPSHGTLTGSGANRVYTPNLNYYGTDSFTYKANDGIVDSNIATVTITVTQVHDKPIANNQSVTVIEDIAKVITLTATNVDGHTLSFSIVTSPAHGTLSGTGANRTYTPNPNYFGPDSFTFKVNGCSLTSNIATVTINVTPVNDASVATGFTVNTNEDTPVGVTLIGTDPDIGDVLTYFIVTQPQHGTLSGTGANLIYTPNKNFTGQDSFTYKVNDGTVDSNIATVIINCLPVDDSPIANSQTIVLDEDTSAPITLTGSDPDGAAITFILITQPLHGTLSGTGPNRIYTPNANFNGNDSFTFKVNNGTDDSNVATVSITVRPVNDAPVALNGSVTYVLNTIQSITLVGIDADGDPLSYTIVSPPANGVLAGSGPNWNYTPNLNYTGSDSFTFKVNDGTVDSNIATITITYDNMVNDAPIAENQQVSVLEDQSKNITLLATDADPHDVLTYTILSGPMHGTLSGTGALRTYTPNPNYNGPDSFTFQASDGSLTSNIATVSITVIPVSDAPIADNLILNVQEDVAKAFVLSGSDADGDVITFTVLTQPAHGVLSGTAPNLTYTPSADYTGSDSFTFKVSDGTSDSNIGTVSIHVVPMNDAPVATNPIVMVDEDTPKVIELIATDAEGDPLTYTIVTPPVHGTLSCTHCGNPVYTPSMNYFGPDGFTFKANDGNSDSNLGTVTITVSPINDAPVVEDKTVTINEGEPVSICLTVTDVENNPSILTAGVSLSGNGTVVLDPTTGPLCFIYTPKADYHGQDVVEVTVCDASDATVCSNGTVTINIKPVNKAPEVKSGDEVVTKIQETTPEDTPVSFCFTVEDPEGNNILLGDINEISGSGTLVADPSAPNQFCFTFTPALNFNGLAVWNVYICDDGSPAACGKLTIEIDVIPVNDAPVAVNDYITVKSSKKCDTVNILANDTDIENDPLVLTTTPIAGPYHGTITMLPDGSFQYQSVLGFIGSDSVRYQVCDTGFPSLCDEAVVFIEVGPAPFKIYTGLSPNGDGLNDYWRIDGIEDFPNNKIRIFDRYNNMIFETNRYSNEENQWRGQINHSLVSGQATEGTYFYSVDLGDGSELLSGYVVIKRN